VARKSKIEPEKGADAAGSESAADKPLPTNGPKKKSRSAAAKPKAKKPAAKKKPPAATAPVPAAEPTDDEIRIRAYFLAERRIRLSLPGDSAHDWIEARRQLIEEAQ
jgi:hypothetical protein